MLFSKCNLIQMLFKNIWMLSPLYVYCNISVFGDKRSGINCEKWGVTYIRNWLWCSFFHWGSYKLFPLSDCAIQSNMSCIFARHEFFFVNFTLQSRMMPNVIYTHTMAYESTHFMESTHCIIMPFTYMNDPQADHYTVLILAGCLGQTT